MANDPGTPLIEFLVSEEEIGQRIDVVLSRRLQQASRTKISEFFREKSVKINDSSVKASYRLRDDDYISCFGELTVSQSKHLVPKPLDLDILYEDDDIIVINKPVGLVVHPGAGTQETTLVEGLLHHCQSLPKADDQMRPGIVHRLDKDTSGVMVCAKTQESLHHLANQFKSKRELNRTYVAILCGVLEKDAIDVRTYNFRDPSSRVKYKAIDENEYEQLEQMNRLTHGPYRHAISHFQVLARYAHCLTKVQVTLDTGRTHQIRVHAAHLGKPVLGDVLYGKKRQWPSSLPPELADSLVNFPRQALHAQSLTITQPRTLEKLTFTVALPQDMQDIDQRLESFET